MFEIPHYATEVYQKREELRNLRENVLLVVRDYNRYVNVTLTFYSELTLVCPCAFNYPIWYEIWLEFELYLHYEFKRMLNS